MREVPVYVQDEGPWGSPIFWGLRPPPKPGAEEMGVRDGWARDSQKRGGERRENSDERPSHPVPLLVHRHSKAGTL